MTLRQVMLQDGKVTRVYDGPETFIEYEEKFSKGKKVTTITIIEYDTPVYLRG